jgi:hypothetical protein
METVAILSVFCAGQEKFAPFYWRWTRTCSTAGRKSSAKRAAVDVA